MRYCCVTQDNDGLIECWKRKDLENIVELHNKAPVWNEGLSVMSCLYNVNLRVLL